MHCQRYYLFMVIFFTTYLHAALITPTLETERCIMRPIALSDASDVFILASDPQIARYTTFFGQTLHQTPDETRDFIQLCLGMQRNNSGASWVIIEKYNNEIIGMINIFGYSTTHRKAEIGYVLSPTYWGRGIMTEVSATLIAYLFHEMQLVRLQATVDPENIGSVQVLQKCGMQHEGLLHNYYIVHGASCNRAMYAILREEFFKRQPTLNR